ncbi:hypothetical protein F4802DRAFT_597349 [Xylaria palmicola]|nr:hypothetical protein F4802DRAFT_597349 [Xylaria palmicola]
MSPLCFMKALLIGLMTRFVQAIPSHHEPGAISAVDIRDHPVPCAVVPVLVGDGSPKQHILHKQVTERVNCDAAPGCQVQFATEISTSFEWSLGLGGPGDADFITGGFAVSKTYTTASTFSCESGPGGRACLWYGQGYTEYQVKNTYGGACGRHINTDVYSIWAPNDDNRSGPGYYCVTDDACRYINDRYWQYNVRDGPP